jgi:biofilm PGA synthesis protein PgaA
LQADAGRSDGSAFSSDSWNANAYYFSKPLAYNYRAYVHDVARYAEFSEGTGHDHRLGVGLEYRGHHFTARGEVNQGFEQNEDAGANISLDWRVTDRIIATAGVAFNSVDVPLRGLRVGIQGDTLTTAATYRWHEGSALTARISHGNFDDDNRRRGYSVGYGLRVLNTLDHKLLTNVSAYVSTNTETNRPYFNPSRDRTYTVGLTHEWHIHRRYQRGLVQRFGVEAGDYWQEDFGNGNIWTFRLEHIWSIGPRWELRYGLTAGGRLYDGDREHASTLLLGMRGRL